MKVPREVILDLMPLYLAGEASAETRALVEEHLRADPAFAEHVRNEWTSVLAAREPSSPGDDVGLRALRRTRRVIALERWLFALGVFFTLTSFSSELRFEGHHLVEAHLLIRDMPLLFGSCLVVGLACLAGDLLLRRRLRAGSDLT